VVGGGEEGGGDLCGNVYIRKAVLIGDRGKSLGQPSPMTQEKGCKKRLGGGGLPPEGAPRVHYQRREWGGGTRAPSGCS